MGWEQKNKCYIKMLSGYESPNGTTMRIEVDLDALMFVSGKVCRQRISLVADSEANAKLLKQAEQHREVLERERRNSRKAWLA
jgi:hypothetical protein